MRAISSENYINKFRYFIGIYDNTQKEKDIDEPLLFSSVCIFNCVLSIIKQISYKDFFIKQGSKEYFLRKQ